VLETRTDNKGGDVNAHGQSVANGVYSEMEIPPPPPCFLSLFPLPSPLLAFLGGFLFGYPDLIGNASLVRPSVKASSRGVLDRPVKGRSLGSTVSNANIVANCQVNARSSQAVRQEGVVAENGGPTEALIDATVGHELFQDGTAIALAHAAGGIVNVERGAADAHLGEAENGDGFGIPVMLA
jgi:hypothetical protein